MREGWLIAVQESAMSDVEDAVLDAVRAQSLELIDRPLFPVRRIGDNEETLIALDPSGQVVTVLVVPTLTAQNFVTALIYSGRHSVMSRRELADLYVDGREAFEADFEEFVSRSFPLSKPGPRLFIFSVHTEPELHWALEGLRDAGVEALRIVRHQGGADSFVEITPNYESCAARGQSAPESATANVEEQAPQATEPDNAQQPNDAVHTRADTDFRQVFTDVYPATSEEPPVETTLYENMPDAAEIADSARQYDTAWDISGWRFEKERPAARAAEEVLDSAAKRQASRQERVAEQQRMLERLERERQSTGTTLYEQTVEASKRPEQRLWDKSAVTQSAELPQPTPTSPDFANHSAAHEPAVGLTPDPRMKRIVDQVGAVKISWRSRRRRASLDGHLTNEGLIEIIGVGIFSDPTQAAVEASGNTAVNGWRIWQVPDGRRLADFP